MSVTSTLEGEIAQRVQAAPDLVANDEQRTGSDRRRKPTPMFSRYVLWGGRRAKIRRTEERENSFVDIHGSGGLLVILAVVALNLLDAIFTLLFLSHGGTELNPVIQWVLDSSWHPLPFIVLKTVGIAIATMFLVMAKHFRPARWGLAFVIGGYSVLLGWHFFLLQYLP